MLLWRPWSGSSAFRHDTDRNGGSHTGPGAVFNWWFVKGARDLIKSIIISLLLRMIPSPQFHILEGNLSIFSPLSEVNEKMFPGFNWCVGRPLVSIIRRHVLRTVLNITRLLKVQKPDKKRKILNHVGRERDWITFRKTLSLSESYKHWRALTNFCLFWL